MAAFPTAGGMEAGRWCPDGRGLGTHVPPSVNGRNESVYTGAVEKLRKVAHLSNLEDEQLSLLAKELTPVLLPPDAKLIDRDTESDKMFFLEKGTLDIIDVNDMIGCGQVGEFKPGSHFGTRALLATETVPRDIIASTPAKVFTLERAAVEKVVGGPLEEVHIKWRTKILKTVDSFKDLTPPQLEKLAKMFVRRQYAHGMLLSVKGEEALPGLAFGIIECGAVVMIDGVDGDDFVCNGWDEDFQGYCAFGSDWDGKTIDQLGPDVRRLEQGQCFGEWNLNDTRYPTPVSPVSIKGVGKHLTILALDADDFQHLKDVPAKSENEDEVEDEDEKQETRVLMVGLDAAGKTTILHKLKLGPVVTTIPTIGFNVETVTCGHINFTCWDVGAKDTNRPLWRQYYQNANAVIMVVDSNDHDRMDEARDELHRMLNEDELKDAALLVFANKQDLPAAMPVDEVVKRLDLNRLRGRKWFIMGSDAVEDEGLREGLDWLSYILG